MAQLALPGLEKQVYSNGFAYEKFWHDIYGRKASRGLTVKSICAACGISNAKFYRLQKTDLTLEFVITICIFLQLDLSHYIYVGVIE